MQVFENRRNEDYLKELEARLTIDGKRGIRERSVKISKPFEKDGYELSRCCRIDFAGIAATNLCDAGGNFVPSSVADRMEEVFDRASELNDEGIFVKLRFLIVYPFSVHAFSRIQAEATTNRASMQQPVFGRNLSLVESVDKQMFAQSHFAISQTMMLEQIQDWVDRHGWTPSSLNKAAVRFAPISPNFCLLFVNDSVFLDPYLLAKRHRAKKQCAHLAPLVHVEEPKNQEIFRAMDDHFRYLWDLDTTMFCQDATYYEPGKPKTLSKIKPPIHVFFNGKAAKIREKSPDLTEDAVQKWKFQVASLLNRFCSEPAPTPGSETVFITCSWEKGGDGQSEPNEMARALSNWLEEDLGRRRPEPLLSVFVMEGVAGEFLTRQLYARLEESTLGLVLLTADIKAKDGSTYSKPNIYHELGFLMKQLGEDRVIVVAEEGVVIPSNIHDVIRVQFERKKLALAYGHIISSLIRCCNFNDGVRREVRDNHTARLKKLTLDGTIKNGEYKKGKAALKEKLA